MYDELKERDWMLFYLVVALYASRQDNYDRMGDKLTFHFPYIRTLPTRLLTPLVFNDNELSLLEGTSLYNSTLLQRRRVEDVRERITLWLNSVLPMTASRTTTLPFMEIISLKQLCWAENILSSRSFPPQVGGWPSTDPPILIPGFDALNHKRGAPVTWTFDASKKAVFTVRGTIATGSQVYNNYGAKSNEELCMSYGFVEPDGPDDVLVLSLRDEKTQKQKSFYWHTTQAEAPDGLRDFLCSLGPADGDELAKTLAEAEATEALEQMLRRRRKAFRMVQADVDDALVVDDPNGLRAPVLAMIRVYRKGMFHLRLISGQSILLQRAIQWTEGRLEELLERLERLNWQP